MADVGERPAAGVTESFDEFYRRVEPQIRRGLIAAIGAEHGHEACAYAMAFGFERWDRVSAMASPAGYLFRVGRNSVRRRRKPLIMSAFDAPAERWYEPGLIDALNRLTESQRTAVMLIAAWGYTQAEAAAVLDVSISTVRNHFARGMNRLRRSIGVNDD